MYNTFMRDGTLMDIEGNVIEKTKAEYPYSYDPIVVFRNFTLESENRIWSDRLLQWDYNKYNQLSRKHFGDESQYWYAREPHKVEAFLSDWLDKTVRLVRITENCNVSNGYPVWSFDYIEG